MPDTGGKTPGRGQGRWARYSKTASFWIILALIPIVMYRLFQPQRDQATELTYSEFSTALDRGLVQKVTIVDGQRVEGTLRAPVVKDGRNYNQFWTRLPFKDSDKLLDRLQAKNVDIQATDARQSWWTLISMALP